MPKELKNIILAITCLVSTWSFSQAHPMQVSAQMIPPYSLKLSDYTTAMNERIVATLLLTDIREQNMQIGIRLYIENGRNIAIQSSPAVMGATPMYINGGVPLRLSNLDLRPYFQLENLQGISPQQYNQPLPDGLYQFCFEVYEWNSGEALSRKSCATAYLVLNDPPILNFPNRGELIAHKEPQNIIFQWTPRHLNATNVQYEFTLTELWDTHMDPQAAFLASRPLYQTTTRANTLLYGPGETALLPDKTYAWRVKALVSDGISETSVFKNGGYSEIFHFTHTGDCDEPAFILAKADSPTSEKIMWQGLGHLKYKIQFRKKVSPSDSPKGGEAREGRWHEINSINEYVTLHNLEGGSTYEFRVGGQCNENAGYTYSQIYEFTTAIPNQALSYNCGITPEIEITNRELLQSLAVNDVFTAGDFPVTVKRITGAPPLGQVGGNGFTGWGYIVVPYLQDTKVRVSFNNIKINTDYQFIEGIIETDYDPTWGGMDDIQDEIVAVEETIEVISDLGAATADILEDVFGETPDNTFDDDADVVVSEGSNTTETGTDSSNNENESPGNNPEADNTGATNSGVGNNPPNESQPGGDVTANDTSTNGDTNSGEVVIVYNGNEFRNGDVIEIDYRNNLENQRFDIKNVDEGSIVSWSLHSDMDQVQAIASAGEGVYTMYDIKNYQNKALEAQYSLNDKSDKIRVQIKLIKEEFEFIELYAKPKYSPKRIAKSNEILYLIDDSGFTEESKHKEVDFGLRLDPKLEKEKIDPLDIKWYYGNNDAEFSKDQGAPIISRNLRIDDELIKTKVKAGYQEVIEKEINVKWVKSRKEIKDFSHKLANFLDFFKVVNEISDKAGKVMPCSATFFKNFDKSTKFKWTDYNIEDEESRHLLDVNRFEFAMEAGNMVKLKCGKDLSLSALGYNISLGEIYAQLTAGLSVSIINDEVYYYENNTFKETKAFSRGGVNIKGEVGLKVGGGVKDEEGNLIIGVEGGGKVEITGGGRIEYPYKGNSDEILGKLYINPLMYTFTGSVKMGPLDHEFKYSDILWDVREQKVIIYNMKTGEIR